MSEQLPYKRRNVFIHRAFQGRFIAWMLGMIVIFGICSAILMYFLLSSDLESETRSVHTRIADTWENLGFSIVVSNLVSALFAGISVVIVVIYISHKIAGPMYRFQFICKEVARGNLDVHSHLRDKDQLQELAHSFGEMVEALKDRRREKQATLDQARAQLEILTEECGGSDRAQQALNALAVKLRDLGDE